MEELIDDGEHAWRMVHLETQNYFAVIPILGKRRVRMKPNKSRITQTLERYSLILACIKSRNLIHVDIFYG